MLAGRGGRNQIARVTPLAAAPRAPYALEPTPFPFPALAAMGGRAGMGGPRETALACLVVARLVAEACGRRCVLTPEQRLARAQGARQWLSSSAVIPPVRSALTRLAEATGAENLRGVPVALDSVIAVTANQLDPAARLDLVRLAQAVAA